MADYDFKVGDVIGYYARYPAGRFVVKKMTITRLTARRVVTDTGAHYDKKSGRAIGGGPSAHPWHSGLEELWQAQEKERGAKKARRARIMERARKDREDDEAAIRSGLRLIDAEIAKLEGVAPYLIRCAAIMRKLLDTGNVDLGS